MQVGETQCSSLGGDYSGEGSDCLQIDCTGACCLPGGSCDDTMTRIDCEAASGSFRGNGISCDQVMCRVEGACCLPSGGCQNNTSSGDCNELDGVWLGIGTACDDLDSDGCFGACCYDDGSCEDVTTQDECENEFGGNFQGVGSTCLDGIDCALEDEQAMNAVRHVVPFEFVMISNSDRTFTIDKFDDHAGFRRLQHVSISIRGQVLLVIILDNSNDGAIEVNNSATLTEGMRVRFEGGVPSLPDALVPIWAPDFPLVDFPLTCVENPVQPGDFCAFESPYVFPGPAIGDPLAEEWYIFDVESGSRSLGPVGRRSSRRGAADNGLRGGFRGGVGSGDEFIVSPGDSTFDIVLNPLSLVNIESIGQGGVTRNPHRAMGEIVVIYEYDFARGGCCLWDGTCLDNVTEEECRSEVGFQAWHPGATCDNLPEPCEPVGACCLCDASCVEGLTETACQLTAGDDGWYAWSPATSCEDAQMCDPVGACCLFHENGGTTCLPNVTFVECDDHTNGIWHECTDCEDVCPDLGACALPTGVCTIATQEPCEEAGGNFLGGGTACEASPSLCRGDANGDKVVNVQDLLIVIESWGDGLFGDLDSDGETDVTDLVLVIVNWGRRCQEF